MLAPVASPAKTAESPSMKRAPNPAQYTPITPGYDKATQAIYKYDPNKAGQLLDQAGWTKGSTVPCSAWIWKGWPGAAKPC